MLIRMYNVIVSSIYSVITGLVGGVGVFMPSAVKEHFFSTRECLLSFILLALLLNGIVNLLLSALMSVLQLFGLKGNFLDRLVNSLFLSTLKDKGYSEGYHDSYSLELRTSRLDEVAKGNFIGSLWKVLKYTLLLMFLYSVIMTSDW